MTHKPLAVGVGAGYGEKAPCEGVAEKGVEASNFRAFLCLGGKEWEEGCGGASTLFEPLTTTTYSFLLLPAKVRKSPRNFETFSPVLPAANQWSFLVPKSPQSVGRYKRFRGFEVSGIYLDLWKE